jgi:hypothetical protein
MVMPEEDMEAYNKFTGAIVATLAPANPLESQLAQSYATFQWRINRAASLEETFLTLGNMEEIAANLQIEHPQAHNAASNAKTFRTHSDVFARASLYSQRLVNQADKVFRQLQHIQAERRQQEQKEMTPAARVYKAFKAQGGTFDPQQNGFVLTVQKVESHIHRQNLQNPTYIAEILRRAA